MRRGSSMLAACSRTVAAVGALLFCCVAAQQPTLPPPLCFEQATSSEAPLQLAAARRTQDGGSARIVWPGTTSQDLWDEYSNIFRYGNRNAASHLWATFILERSWQMRPTTVADMFKSFCPVSGSPVRSTTVPYRVTLDSSQGSPRTGFLHYCCWPCLCDTVDFLKLDTKTIETADGPRQYWFTVLGNPCGTSRGAAFLEDEFVSPFDGSTYTLSRVAAEVRCSDDGELIGATLSDSGLPIIGMIHDSVQTIPELITPLTDPEPGRITVLEEFGSFNDYRDMQPLCQERAENGYASGMGEIFRQVAGVAPLLNSSGQEWSHGVRVGVPSSSSPQPRSGASLSVAVDEKAPLDGERAGNLFPVIAIVCAVALTVLVVAGYAGIQHSRRQRAGASKVTNIAPHDVEEASAHDA